MPASLVAQALQSLVGLLRLVSAAVWCPFRGPLGRGLQGRRICPPPHTGPWGKMPRSTCGWLGCTV